MTFPQTINASASPEVQQNDNNLAIQWTGTYSHNAPADTGLVRGYNGGRWGGFSIADVAHTFGGSTTTYVSVLRSTGALDFNTASTNYNNTATYAKVETVVSGTSSITSTTDDRAGPGGVHGAGPVASVTIDTDGTLAANSDILVASQKATKTYVDGRVSSMGGGDTSTTVSVSVDSEVAIYNGTSGKSLKRASGTGYAKLTSGVLSAATTAATQVDLQGDGLTSGQVGFRNIPQNSKSADYTCVAADAGKHVFHPGSDTSTRTYTIPANASVALPLGAAITFVNQSGAGAITIAITSDVMRLAGAGTTGNRTLAANGIATALKVTTTEWLISGSGLT